jgi:hypothetical protein
MKELKLKFTSNEEAKFVPGMKELKCTLNGGVYKDLCCPLIRDRGRDTWIKNKTCFCCFGIGTPFTLPPTLG